MVSVELYAYPALSSLNRWKGRRRAAFWRRLGFSNPVLTRAAKAHQLEERLKRTDRNRGWSKRGRLGKHPVSSSPGARRRRSD
jgi:hypothetical protein